MLNRASIKKILEIYDNDFKVLLSLAANKANDHSRLLSIYNGLQSMAPDQVLSTEAQLFFTAFMRGDNREVVWLANAIDRYVNTIALKKRLHDFMGLLLGCVVVKLSECINEDKTVLAIDFPSKEMCHIFLNRTGMAGLKLFSEGDVEPFFVRDATVFISAFVSLNQQLAIKLPSNEIKNKFIKILNLSKGEIISSNSNDNCLYINDRRIHDTGSKFSLAIVCTYFIEFVKVQYAAHMLDQASRDTHSLFYRDYFPKELSLKIAANVSSSTVIDEGEKLQIAELNYRRP